MSYNAEFQANNTDLRAILDNIKKINHTLGSKVVTPTKQEQVITPDGEHYGLSEVTVEAIPDAYQDVTSVTATENDVLNGKKIVDVNGDVVVGNIPLEHAKTITPSTTEKVAISAGTYASGDIMVKAIPYAETTNISKGITVTIG